MYGIGTIPTTFGFSTGTLSNVSLQYTTGIITSHWCIDCFPQYVGAPFMFMGNSVCEKHFKQKCNNNTNVIKKVLLDEGR